MCRAWLLHSRLWPYVHPTRAEADAGVRPRTAVATACHQHAGVAARAGRAPGATRARSAVVDTSPMAKGYAEGPAAEEAEARRDALERGQLLKSVRRAAGRIRIDRGRPREALPRLARRRRSGQALREWQGVGHHGRQAIGRRLMDAARVSLLRWLRRQFVSRRPSASTSRPRSRTTIPPKAPPAGRPSLLRSAAPLRRGRARRLGAPEVRRCGAPGDRSLTG